MERIKSLTISKVLKKVLKQTCLFLVTLAGPSSKALIFHWKGKGLYIKKNLLAYKCNINSLTKGPHKGTEKKTMMFAYHATLAGPTNKVSFS